MGGSLPDRTSRRETWWGRARHGLQRLGRLLAPTRLLGGGVAHPGPGPAQRSPVDIAELPVWPGSWLVRYQLLAAYRQRRRSLVSHPPTLCLIQQQSPLAVRASRLSGARPQAELGHGTQVFRGSPSLLRTGAAARAVTETTMLGTRSGWETSSTAPALRVAGWLSEAGLADGSRLQAGRRPAMVASPGRLFAAQQALRRPTWTAGGQQPASGRPPQRRPLGQPVATRRLASLEPGSPESRWRAAVADTPLEHPMPLPQRWVDLAQSITGRSHTRFTTGPATRRALQAAGAVGATTGSVLHLAQVPSSTAREARILTHELAHSRTPLVRPRFLLVDHGSGHDEEEQRAGAAEAAAGPVGLVGAAADRMGRTISPSLSTPGTGSDRPGIADLPVTQLVGLVQAVGKAAGWSPQPAPTGGLNDERNLPTGDSSLQLPSSGPAAATARQAASAESEDGRVPVNSEGGGASSAGAGTGAPNTVSGAVGGRNAGAAATGTTPPDLDRLLESLEERMLREIERRGGRYEGVF